MAKPKDMTAPTMAPEKLAEFDGLIREGVPLEKIAEISGASLEDVKGRARALAALAMAADQASNVIPDGDDEDDDTPRKRGGDEGALAQRWAELAKREAALAARERGLSSRRPTGRVIRVTRTFDAVTPHPHTGKPQAHRFAPSLFRGDMAERVESIAFESGNTDCIEVVSEG